MSSLDELLSGDLQAIEAAGLRRELRRWTGAQGPWIELDGVRLSSFSSNNYLALADHPALRRAAAEALEQAGVGAGASRLIAGNHAEHEALESELARFHGVQAALIFNSGFQANAGTIPALVGPEDLVLSDRLNHASLIDGCRLSRARTLVYDHGDAIGAGRLLAEHRRRHRRCLVVTESVFSMDGDTAPLPALAGLAAAHDAWLMVDEAHAVGVLGPGGKGICAELAVVPDILTGTLGKAFGTCGAYVAGTLLLRTYLLHRARSFVFSTALPPALAAASRAALRLVESSDGASLRETLRVRIRHLSEGLAALGILAPGAGLTPIFPVHVGEERQALAAARHLWKAGIHAQAIRPPTVARGTSRLRLALMATHAPAQLDHLLTELSHLTRAGHLPSAQP